MKKRISKLLFNLAVFVILILLTFHFCFQNININDFIDIIKVSNMKYILIGILCMLMYLFIDGLNTRRIINLYNNNVSVLKSFKYALILFFFSSITPSSTGGQPMQMYYMKKDGIKLSSSLSSSLICLSTYQICTIGLAVFSIFYNLGYIMDANIGVKIMLLVGLLLNFLVLVFTLASLFSNKLINGILHMIEKILKFFRIRKRDAIIDKLEGMVDDYKDCSKVIKKNKKVFYTTIAFMLLELVFYHSIPFCVYKAFGLSGTSYIYCLSIQILLFIASAAIPLPGAVGISEMNFMLMYGLLFPGIMLNSAMLLSRGISFYLFVLISGLFILINYLYHLFKK